ncbi:MAG: ABC transporter ATP-binding protein [SAR324 cluster bacterium]|nr:ABC transporter ATP-binding protein [SAR324 cluster bacterium]
MPAVSKDKKILEIKKLNSGYGRSQVLFDVSMTVPEKGGVAIFGRNGVGKTTLLKSIIADEITQTGGSIEIDGEDISTHNHESRIAKGIGYVPQDLSIFSTLTVKENLILGTPSKKPKSDISYALDMFPKLKDRINQKAGTLSGGERKMLTIGRALLGQPRLLLLDEPSEGVWVGVVSEIGDRLCDLARQMTIVIVEQNIDLGLRVTNKACVMHRGEIVLSGSAKEIQKDNRLKQYLAP